jgi:hypothetical protein
MPEEQSNISDCRKERINEEAMVVDGVRRGSPDADGPCVSG